MKVYVEKNNVYYHLIIPSESEFKENDYDIILKFIPRNQADLDDKSYRQYEMQVFSNCPSFTYTYAYVAKLNGYLIPELMDKYEEQVQKLLGHTKIDTTMQYAMVDQNNVKNSYRKYLDQKT